MGRVYATPSDLAAYGAPPSVTLPTGAEAARQLARASERVDIALLSAVYATDPITQLPTDARIAEALRDATCAQVVYWNDPDGETGETGTTKVYGSVKIGSVSLSKGSGGGGSGGGGSAGSNGGLAPQAMNHLRLAVDARGVSLLIGTAHTGIPYYW